MNSRPDLKLDWATHEAAAYACKVHHYSRSLPVGKLVKVGVWENGRFTGVVIFSRGAAINIGSPYGLPQTEICELTRVSLAKQLHSRYGRGGQSLAWLRTHIDPNSETFETAGKRKYLMPLDDQMREKILPLAMPYPKRAKQAMVGSPPTQRQCDTDPHAPQLLGTSTNGKRRT